MNKDLQIGQRVRLSESSEWALHSGNPTDCEGVIVKDGRYGWLMVDWDNGETNEYREGDSDLIPVEATADSALETLV